MSTERQVKKKLSIFSLKAVLLVMEPAEIGKKNYGVEDDKEEERKAWK